MATAQGETLPAVLRWERKCIMTPEHPILRPQRLPCRETNPTSDPLPDLANPTHARMLATICSSHQRGQRPYFHLHDGTQGTTGTKAKPAGTDTHQ